MATVKMFSNKQSIFIVKSFPGSSVVKNPPSSVGDTKDLGSIPGSGNLLEKEMETHSHILAWEIT